MTAAVGLDPRHSSDAELFRKQVRHFLDEHLPADWEGLGAIADREEADRFVERWRATLAANGLLGVSWPKEYGGAGLSRLEQVVLVEELARAGVPAMGYNDTFGIKMLGGTLLRWGTEAQKRRFLPRILSGDDRWCQGFSEPGSGSDLASLSTRAVLDGDHWVIDGQKLWTSRAREANWIFLLARTNQDARKHAGITFLLVDMRQPGVEVRPIRALSGESEFNEVFFTGATTPADHVVGEVDQGWAVASTLLGLERGEEAATNPILFRAELDRLLALARQLGRTTDPVLRQRLADAHVRCEIMRFLGLAHPHRRAHRRRHARAGGIDLQALLERVPPRDHRARARHPRRGGHGRRRAWSAAGLPDRRPGSPQHHRLVARHLLQRHCRNDLRRHLRGATEHPRRERARPPALARAFCRSGRVV